MTSLSVAVSDPLPDTPTMRARRKKTSSHKPVSKTAARRVMRDMRERRKAILGDFEARKSGHEVKLAKGNRVARVQCSSSAVAEIFISSVTRWERFFPELELARIAELGLLEVELGPPYIDASVEFWRGVRPEWSPRTVLGRVALEAKAALFAQRKRRFGSCFSGPVE